MITRRELLVLGSLAALAVTAEWNVVASAENKTPIPVMLYKTPGCECGEGYADYLGAMASP